jgi:hypothetical protein
VLVLIGSYLVLVLMLPVALSLLVSYRALPHGRNCPHCHSETLRIQARRLATLSALMPAATVEKRWCMGCGWEGAVKAGAVQPVRARRPARARTTQTLDIRSVDVDGAAWRVMLQCWNSTGLYYGRFIFVGPSGRLWLDAVESFAGSTEHEVLGQALSLPECAFEDRLRRLVTER